MNGHHIPDPEDHHCIKVDTTVPTGGVRGIQRGAVLETLATAIGAGRRTRTGE